MNKKIKGHLAPKGFRTNQFNSIEINDTNLSYCKSHNFVFDAMEEERKLYNGLPCFYTDSRYTEYKYNFYKSTKLEWKRFKNISLESCKRKVLKCKNIPVGTIVNFKKSYTYTTKKGKRIKNSYSFKIQKENFEDIQYEVNIPGFFDNFKICSFSSELVNRLRTEGFLVDVCSSNPNFLIGLINTASSFVGKEIIENNEEEGETAIAYGYGKKIGISSKNNSLFGYSNACDNILYDKFDEFCKWSRCEEIPKSADIDEIVKILKTQ